MAPFTIVTVVQKSFILPLHMRRIHSLQTLGGCLGSAWSCSDVIPLLMAMKATILLASSGKGYAFGIIEVQ